MEKTGERININKIFVYLHESQRATCKLPYRGNISIELFTTPYNYLETPNSSGFKDAGELQNL